MRREERRETAMGRSLERRLAPQRATRAPRIFATLCAGFGAAPAQAAFLSGDALDTMADWIALIVLFVVPCTVIVLFWIVHVLPEKIAHKRHHPQRDAIQTLCLLSLVFGGLLWPIAWIWAYTRPVGYRAAYGTDKHEDYYLEMAQKHRTGSLVREDIVHLREDLDAMEARGALPPRLRALKLELERVAHDAAPATAPVPASAPAAGPAAKGGTA